MKPLPSNRAIAGLIGAAIALLTVPASQAAEIFYKPAALSTAEVTTNTNWYGEVVPGTDDIAAWVTDGDAGTAGNQESRGGALTVSSPVSWLGLRFEDSAGDVYLSGSPITLGASGITEVRWQWVFIDNNIVLASNQTWNTGNQLTLNGTVTGAFDLTKTGGGDLVVTNTTLGGGLVHVTAGRLVINPATVGGTVTIQSLRTQRDVRMGNDVLLDVTSGLCRLSTAAGFWIQPSGTGATGRLTSSSGTLDVSSVDSTGVLSTGNLGVIDHRIRTYIVDYGATKVGVTKSGVHRVQFYTANTYSNGTTINAGMIQANSAASFGTGAVTVNSGAQASLAASGTFLNDFVVEGQGPNNGTTNIGALRLNNNTISGDVTIGAGGARVVAYGGDDWGNLATALDTSADGTITGTLSGTGPLEINNPATGAAGTLTLSGDASGYKGTVTLSKGGLVIGPGVTLDAAAVNVAAGTLTVHGTLGCDHTHTAGVLQGSGTIDGNLTLNATSAADVLNILPGALHVTGDLTLDGSTTVRASGMGGQVTVLTYDGSLTGDATNLAIEDLANFRAGTALNTDEPGIITLDIAGDDLTWTNGAGTGLWSTASADANWDNGGAQDYFYQSDAVTFGDTAAGTVTIVGVIAPSSVTIDSASDYTLTGTAGNYLSGSTGITKGGAGALTLASPNNFQGGVVINEGNLLLSTQQAFAGGLTLNGGVTTVPVVQAYTGGTTINSGAVLDITGGGGQVGVIRGTVNVDGSGILRVTNPDGTGWGTGDRISALNLTNGGTLEINNSTDNQTFSNMSITLTGGNIVRGANAAAYNGNFDLFNGSTSVTSLASDTTSVIAAGVNLGLRQPDTTFTTALGTTPSGIDLLIDASVNNSPSNWTTPNLIKAGPGTLCLNNPPASGIGNSTVYSGTTTINEGTLLVGNGGTTGIIGTGPITDNAALVFNRSDVVTVANTVTGTGTLEQAGTGALNLTSGGNRLGDTIVSAGELYVGTTPFTASTFRATGGTLLAGTSAALGTGMLPALDLDGGTAAVRMSTASSDRIVVSGTNGFTVTSASGIACRPAGSLQTGDTIPLIDYVGAIGGLGFPGLSLVPGNPHYGFSLVDNTTDTRVDATVTKTDTVVWIGNLSGDWDEELTSNWQTVSDSQTSLFYDYDKVKFTDAGSANTTVTLVGEITPAVVEFDATIDYTLAGTGITGATSLVKKNTGKVTLTNDNTYSGATTVSAGTLEVGDGATSGSIASTAITVDGTLALNRSDALTIPLAITGSSTGQLVQRGTGTTTLTGASTAYDGTVIVEAGTVVVGNANALGSAVGGAVVQDGGSLDVNGYTLPAGKTVTFAGAGGAGVAALTGAGGIPAGVVLTADATIGDDIDNRLDLGTSLVPVTITGAYTLTKVGLSTVWYRGPDQGAGNSLAALVIDGGRFGIEASDNALNGVPVTVNPTGVLSSWAKLVDPDFYTSTQNNPITLNGGSLGCDAGGDVWSGPVTLTANSFLGAAGSDANFTVTGAIGESGGSFGLTKPIINAETPSTSIITLAGVNTYTGDTTIEAGTIVLADNAALTFVIGANGVCNKVTGAGAATFNGDFVLDLSGADATPGNSWILADATTKTFGATFTVAGFGENAGVHTLTTGGNTWTFTEANATLTVAAATGFDSWIAGTFANGSVPADQRGATDDPDGDGLDNLVEYALAGLDPTVPGGFPGTLDGLSVSFAKRQPLDTGIAYAIEESTDLGAADPWAEVTPTVNDATTISYTLPGGPPTDFMRLKVTQN